MPVLRADFLRYLIMLARGGVYSDIDTSTMIAVDEWVPEQYQSGTTINAIVGIEYDDTTYNMFVRPISFTQWTLMAKPGHNIFDKAVSRVMSNIEFLARRKRVDLSDLKLEKGEVLEATGPGMYTDVVIEVIRDQGIDVTWRTFHNLKEPALFGDILVFPVNAFAGNQKHSHSSDPAYGPKFVQHHFGRTWYTKQPPGTEEARA
jgi:alpha 1,6-mannosyltransferase